MNRSSPEQIIGTLDPQNFFEGANLLWKTTNPPKGKQRFRVLSGFSDLGESHAIMPVLDVLAQKPSDIFVVANRRGEEALRTSESGFHISRKFNPLRRIERMNGSAVITGYSEYPSVEMVLNFIAHQKRVPCFAIEDYPGTYSYNRVFQATFTEREDTIPDYLFVMNEWARRANLAYPFLPEDRIIVTGAPAMDKIAHIDKARVRREVREQLKIRDDETLITWFGQVEGSTVESLQVFLNGLRTLKGYTNYKLAVRFHPHDQNPKETYDNIFRPFADRYVDASRAVEPDAQRVIAASDLIVQERSTIALQAAAMGIPAISIAIPEIVKSYGVMIGFRAPVIEDGTSPLVSKKEDMAAVLQQVLFDTSYRKHLDIKMQSWKPDGKAAERIADKIIELTT